MRQNAFLGFRIHKAGTAKVGLVRDKNSGSQESERDRVVQMLTYMAKRWLGQVSHRI
jgi:hypothetical protein